MPLWVAWKFDRDCSYVCCVCKSWDGCPEPGFPVVIVSVVLISIDG